MPRKKRYKPVGSYGKLNGAGTSFRRKKGPKALIVPATIPEAVKDGHYSSSIDESPIAASTVDRVTTITAATSSSADEVPAIAGAGVRNTATESKFKVASAKSKPTVMAHSRDFKRHDSIESESGYEGTSESEHSSGKATVSKKSSTWSTALSRFATTIYQSVLDERSKPTSALDLPPRGSNRRSPSLFDLPPKKPSTGSSYYSSPSSDETRPHPAPLILYDPKTGEKIIYTRVKDDGLKRE